MDTGWAIQHTQEQQRWGLMTPGTCSFPYTWHSFQMGQGGEAERCTLMEAFRWLDLWRPFSSAASFRQPDDSRLNNLSSEDR